MGAEFDLIDIIRTAACADQGGGVVAGIGDDCAVWAPPAGVEQLISTDLLLEGVHFERAWGSLGDLGGKALMVNVSDIAAMGGVPRYLTLGLGLPGPPDGFQELVSGFLAAASSLGVTLIGGDTCFSHNGLMISVTIIGELPAGTAIKRSGARPGDALYVTGTVGDSAAGLACLQHPESAPKNRQHHDRLLDRHLRPVAQTEAGRVLREQAIASAMIDVSDGIAADLGHILVESAVGAEIDADCLPLSPALDGFCAAGGGDALALALGGGEDYELLFTVPPTGLAALETVLADGRVSATRIGRITGGGGLQLRRNGTLQACPVGGFEHRFGC